MIIFNATSRLAAGGSSLFRGSAWCSQLLLRVSRVARLLIASALLVPASATANPATIVLESDSTIATAGYYRLSWQASPGIDRFLLQESTDADFTAVKDLYRGSDTASVISGRPDNEYFYRVLGLAGPTTISNTIKVTVAHHPLRNAFGFFSVGAIVFIATLLLIVRGNRQET